VYRVLLDISIYILEYYYSVVRNNIKLAKAFFATSRYMLYYIIDTTRTISIRYS
jgi:hypothetical protein